MWGRRLCFLFGHDWRARIYPPGAERCAKCNRKRHGLIGMGAFH